MSGWTFRTTARNLKAGQVDRLAGPRGPDEHGWTSCEEVTVALGEAYGRAETSAGRGDTLTMLAR